MSEGAGFGRTTEQNRQAGQSSGAAIPGQRHGSAEPADLADLADPAIPVARVFDGARPDGSPLISRQNLDPREIPALVAYLTRAPVALSAPGTTRDELVTSAPASVPRAFHTDGTWVWPAAVGYYLSLYRLPPQAELLAHIRSRNYALEPVHPQTIEAVASQVLAMLKSQAAAPAQAPIQAHAPAHAQTQAQPQLPAQPHAQARPESRKPEVASLRAFSPAFNAAGNRHAAWVTEQLDTFLAFLPLGNWSVDHTTRRYLQSGRSIVVDGLGTLSADGVWTWAWADPATWGQDPTMTEQSRRLRALGQAEGIVELATPRFGLSGIADAPDSPQDAAEMIAWTAMGLLGARGYIGHSASDSDGHADGDADGGGGGRGGGGSSSNGGRIYYVVCDTAVPVAAARLETAPKFVMEGVATFGEDTADCVIGYAEYHGWEWSRLPDGIGIVVAVEGVGSFTAEISPDGELAGVSTGPLLRA
jgi:uncharacterized membrane protein YgcG